MTKIINWMGGWPKDGLVSVSDWEERLAEAAERSKREGLASLERPGLRDGLKESLASGLLKEKTEGFADRLKLASGADAALAGLAERSLSPGDVVLTENLTSRSALHVFGKAGIRVEAVESDGHGMIPDALGTAIAEHRPRLVYAAPACSDPGGTTWPRERYSAVAGVCRNNGVTLVRDDRQDALIYEDALAAGGTPGGPVQEGILSIGQLPPGLVAGLKFGWLIGMPNDLEQWLPASAFPRASAHTGVTPLERQALSEMLRDQPVEPLLDMLRVQCRERMRRLTGLLKIRSAPGLRWRDPQGGVHLWLTLQEGLDGKALLRGAWMKGLMFQPGAAFYAREPEPNKLRLTFAYADERQMKLGVTRLMEAMDDFLGRFDIG